MKKALLALSLFILSLAVLALLTARSLIGTYFSEVHSTNWFGPGVDVFFMGVSPAPGDTLNLEVKVRGGSAAGITAITAVIDNEPPQIKAGKGVTWSGHVSSKSVGQDFELISLSIPEGFAPQTAHDLTLEVDYVTAMSSSWSYSNETKQERLRATFFVVSPAMKWIERLALVLKGLLCFGFACWFTALLTKRFKDKTFDDDELMGYLILELTVASGFVAYWLFSWPIQRALSLHGDLFATLFVLSWYATLLWVMIKFGREKAAPLVRYTLRLEAQRESADPDPYRSPKTPEHIWVSLLELDKLLQREGLRTRLWFWSLSVSSLLGKAKIKIGRDDDVLVFSRDPAQVYRISRLLASQVGTVYLDDGKTTQTLTKQ